jgi:hypothetical protein
MYRKLIVALSAITILALLGGGLAFANGELPTWETAFDPVPAVGPYSFIHAIEEFKGDLFAVAGDPAWFGADDPRVTFGQIFRSPNGENWTPATEAGFGLGEVETGCGMDYYDTAWDMVIFKGKLYVTPTESTCSLRPGVVLRTSDGNSWETSTTTQDLGLYHEDEGYIFWYGQFRQMAVFEGLLYVNVPFFNYDPLADLWYADSKVFRSPSGDPGTWEEAGDFPGVFSLGPFHVFKGALYIVTDDSYDADWNLANESIWRTFDGVNWETVVSDGFGNDVTDSFGGMADYKGYLYVGIGTWSGGPGQIWRSLDGVNWENVIADGFGDPVNIKVDGLVVYAGDLYAYTVTQDNLVGGSVFRTKDAVNWEPVNEPGWGNPDFKASHLSADQAVFKDELYMGVVGPGGVLFKMVHPDK